jgi:lipopolysaccharide export system protein LptA
MKFFTTLIMFAIFSLPAFAQSEFRPATTLVQGSGPIKIEADVLEVHDKDKAATFTGNVLVTRNDTTIHAGKMTVFYAGSGATGTVGLPTADQQVKRIEMSGHVLFVQKDQQGSGDSAVYEKASEMMTMSGNVVLTQGQNVAKGQKLIVNMKNGQARLEGRPRMILMPNDAKIRNH